MSYQRFNDLGGLVRGVVEDVGRSLVSIPVDAARKLVGMELIDLGVKNAILDEEVPEGDVLAAQVSDEPVENIEGGMVHLGEGEVMDDSNREWLGMEGVDQGGVLHGGGVEVLESFVQEEISGEEVFMDFEDGGLESDEFWDELEDQMKSEVSAGKLVESTAWNGVEGIGIVFDSLRNSVRQAAEEK